MATLSSFLRILRYLLIPYHRNPGGLNIDSVLFLLGGVTWVACALGEAYGFAHMPNYVASIGPFLTGYGVRGAASNSKPPRHPNVK